MIRLILLLSIFPVILAKPNPEIEARFGFAHKCDCRSDEHCLEFDEPCEEDFCPPFYACYDHSPMEICFKHKLHLICKYPKFAPAECFCHCGIGWQWNYNRKKGEAYCFFHK